MKRDPRAVRFATNTPGWTVVSLDDLYRQPPWPKPRKARRVRRRRAAWWRSLTDEERALYTLLWDEMRLGLAAELDAVILHGAGRPVELVGILGGDR